LGIGRALGVGLSSAAAAPLSQTKPHHDDLEGTPVWVLYVTSMALVLLGGAFAGLTIA
jgi:metal transporter CNNM